MIDKELLSEVLDFEADYLCILANQVYWRVRRLYEGLEYFEEHEINIYELAHKCKEWIFSKNYYFHIEEYNSNDVTIYIYKKDASCRDDFEEILSAKNYIKAIFKACQWIMENKDDN